MEFNERAFLTDEEFNWMPVGEVCAMGDELMWRRIFDYMKEEHEKHPGYGPTKLLYMFYNLEAEKIMDEADYEEEGDDADSI
jgi:hypothetical protein